MLAHYFSKLNVPGFIFVLTNKDKEIKPLYQLEQTTIIVTFHYPVCKSNFPCLKNAIILSLPQLVSPVVFL